MFIDVYVTVLGSSECNSSVSLEAWIEFSLEVKLKVLCSVQMVGT